jgi:glycosyltransferase involved in cell wall biosynthesis
VLFSVWFKKQLRRKEYEQQLQDLASMIIGHHGFIDLFHSPMGWSTPLFQRFQHMSLQAARLGGLALYGGHPQVDKDVFVFKYAQDNVVVFDALDERVVACVFDALRLTSQTKILRLQSIDLVTRLEDIERFIDDGITVVYEYIDAISEEITGAIPDFVIERHMALLRDERVLVVATSDNLFEEVRQQRGGNCLLSTNGVDLDHWRKAQHVPPSDIEPVVQSGRTVVGYHGALANWIDYELLRRIADDGSYELVLIGYEHDASFAESRLAQHPRVHFIGSKSYFVLNEYAAFYDIGILPFKRSALTDSVSPVKLFEYMAAGKPVVTTDLGECSKYASCLVAKSQDAFLKHLRTAAAAKQDKTYMAALATDAELNSWREKAVAMYNLAGVSIERDNTPVLLEENAISTRWENN